MLVDTEIVLKTDNKALLQNQNQNQTTLKKTVFVLKLKDYINNVILQMKLHQKLEKVVMMTKLTTWKIKVLNSQEK